MVWKRKHPVSNSSLGKKWLVNGSSKMKMTRFLRNLVCRRAFLNREHVEPWSRWATAADICQKRKLKLINCMASKIWQQKIEKMLPRLMSLDFFCYIQIVGSKWHENYESMDQTWLVSTIQADSRVMGDIFLALFVPLSTKWTCLTASAPPEYCFWPYLSLYGHSVPVFW